MLRWCQSAAPWLSPQVSIKLKCRLWQALGVNHCWTALLRRPCLINAAGSERFKDATVLVAGATGGVGRRVVQRLAREGATVKALVRDFAKGVSPERWSVVERPQCLDPGCAGQAMHTNLPRLGAACVTASSAWLAKSNRGPH